MGHTRAVGSDANPPVFSPTHSSVGRRGAHKDTQETLEQGAPPQYRALGKTSPEGLQVPGGHHKCINERMDKETWSSRGM